jgi:hypothetical protein
VERQDAILQGFPTYAGAVHARCGTSQRYTSSGSCVVCARTIATEQREARRLLKAQAEGRVDPALAIIEDQRDEDRADALFEQDMAVEDDIDLDEMLGPEPGPEPEPEPAPAPAPIPSGWAAELAKLEAKAANSPISKPIPSGWAAELAKLQAKTS